ncbi:MAG: hypothetical protein NUW01_02160 [Gemmatimonadaceae bacterium]|nr:hypothetical protein [Gemmatimonadaceae bacterium]
MRSNPYIMVPKVARNYRFTPIGVWISNKAKLIRHSLIKLAVNPPNKGCVTDSDRTIFIQALVDKRLDFDVSSRLSLQRPNCRIFGKLVSHRTFDVRRMCGMSLNAV